MNVIKESVEMPDKASTTDILMGYRAAMSGAADEIDKAMLGQRAIIKLLQDTNIDLNGFHKEGLLAALDILADSVACRGWRLMECLDEHAEQLGCARYDDRD
ncbi:hypothetical protein [Salinicola peritrichatus]|uniref:hypothetical protein n=1 Tax=Salinicola peritrichatus TaxID=1267424 RepID=UPI000DA19CB3|nr:hypothetical protein [Salinicola peritrichatus]